MTKAEKKLFISAAVYGVLGIAAGLFWRTYVHTMGMEDSKHLSMLHTHILTLGFFFFLIALILEKTYAISKQVKLFRMFFWHYSAGLAITIIAMFIIGIIQANGGTEGPAIVGISGLGHIILTAGLFIFIANLRKAIRQNNSKSE